LLNANVNFKEKNYLSYAKGKDVIVISSNKNVYFLNSTGLIKTENHSQLATKKLFRKNNIKEGKRFTNDDYQYFSEYVYVSLYENGKKVFYFNLPYMPLDSRGKKVEYPFNYEVLGVLHKLLMDFFGTYKYP